MSQKTPKKKKPDELLLVRMNRNVRKLLEIPGNIYHYDWSPDGRSIAITTSGPKLVVADVQTGKMRELAEAKYWSDVVWASQR